MVASTENDEGRAPANSSTNTTPPEPAQPVPPADQAHADGRAPEDQNLVSGKQLPAEEQSRSVDELPENKKPLTEEPPPADELSPSEEILSTAPPTVNELPPPVVHGIEDVAAPRAPPGVGDKTPAQNGAAGASGDAESVDAVDGIALEPADDGLVEVREGDLKALIDLFVRFQARVERLATGRKLGPLREAWEATRTELERYPEKLDVGMVTERLVEALRLGCESSRVLIVDACLDCIHRLFEYGHVGSAPRADASAISLDSRDGRALDEIVAMVCGCLETKEDEVYLRMVQTLLTAATQTQSGLHHGTLLAAVRTVYNIFLNAREPGVRTSARVCIVQILSLVFSRMEAEIVDGGARLAALASYASPTAVDVPRPQPPVEDGGEAGVDFASVLQKDAYLLFRALCKISAKDMPEGALPESVGFRSKLLSLELLRSLVSNSGPAFRTGERFIYALRQYLAPSLLSNSMSSSMAVVDVSLDIFELLLRRETIRPLLKTEIGVIFKAVIFRFLESPTAGPNRRRKALELLNRLASDHQTLADLFLNYDCDMDSPKIFEHIVSSLSSAAERKAVAPTSGLSMGGSQAAAAMQQQAEIRMKALSSIVLIVRSLRNWSKPIEEERVRRASDVVNGFFTGDSEPEADGMNESPYKGDADKAENINPNGAKATQTLTKSTSSMGGVSEGSDRDTSRFEEALKAKKVLMEGISKFNTKPKKGVEHLIKNNRLPREAKAVADFLHRTENLDATMIGEYLGEGDPFAISVMHAYTDMNDFTGLDFDIGLRRHLTGFRLPGESQKIDRVMEKFASRYCECNPGVFANADAAYVLAYSTIMLHTDAHNAQVKNKMRKEEFIRNNRGINDGGDLDPKLLSTLYDRITRTEIMLAGNLKDTKKNASTDGGTLSSNAIQVATVDPAVRARQFKEESERLMEQTRILFANKRKSAEDYTYYSATNLYHARLMFETACFPLLAAISLLLEEATPTDGDIVALCLEGFRNGIAIASTFSMSTAKDAFVLSLSKFTHLNHVAQMRAKNVECVRMMLAIASLEGNNLGEQWTVIVRAISQLEQIRAMVAGNPAKYILMKSPIAPAVRMGGENDLVRQSSSNRASTPQDSGQMMLRRSYSNASGASSNGVQAVMATYGNIRLDPKAAALASAIGESEIERIFTNSSRLSQTGVVDFCGALCEVSLEELGEKTGPGLFCLQKIVELAYYNMDSRTRLQWSKIWDKMGPFFASAMTHTNKDVAMYSIDALRQLASKFLDKDELSNFSFQRAFLKPFEVCFSRSSSFSIRELVLTCVSQIAIARAANIKSGWKSVFALLALSSEDKSDDLMNFGFRVAQVIVDKCVGVYDDVFIDSVNGVSAYVRSTKSLENSLSALDMLINKCAAALGEGRAISNSNGVPAKAKGESNNEASSESNVLFTADKDSDISAWFPVLTGLASAMQDSRQQISRGAGKGLFQVLKDYGGKFSPSLWTLIFRGVLSPLFDDVRYLSNSMDKNESNAIAEWATAVGAPMLRSLVDVFVMHIEVTRGLLPDLIELLRGWITQDAENVAREGMGILARMILMSGDNLIDKDWQNVVNGIMQLFEETMPHEIIGPKDLTTPKPKEDLDALDGYVAEEKNARVDEFEVNGQRTESENENGSAHSNDKVTEAAIAASIRESEEENEKLKNSEDLENRAIDFRVVRSKCVVQLLLIQLVQDAVVSFYTRMSAAHVYQLAESLHTSYTFAKDFNGNVELRYSLWRAGFMNQVPNLLKQETSGLTTYLRIMFWLYLDPARQEEQEELSLEQAVVNLCDSVLKRFISTSDAPNPKTDDKREIAALTPIVILIVNGMMQMSVEQFEKHLGNMYDILLQLVESASDRKVRRAICRLMRARIGPQLRRLVARKNASSSTDVDEVDHAVTGVSRRESEFVARPQIPGPVRDRVLAVEGEDSAEGVEAGVQMALSKLSGVRSATVSMEQGIARVTASTPDDLLLSTVESVPKVRSVFLVQSSDSPLLVG